MHLAIRLKFAPSEDKLLWRNAHSTMLMQREPLFFIDFSATGGGIATMSCRYLAALGIEAVIPPRASRTEPIHYDAKKCKLRTAQNSVNSAVCRKGKKRLLRMRRSMNLDCERKLSSCSTSIRKSLTIPAKELDG